MESKHQNQKKLVLEFWWEFQDFGFWGFFCKILHELTKAPDPDETEKRIRENRQEKLAYEGIGKMQLGTAGL